VDDTPFLNKGQHSVGVARQYRGVLGKRDNCQVAVKISLATEQASLPVAGRLHLSRLQRSRIQVAVIPPSTALLGRVRISVCEAVG